MSKYFEARQVKPEDYLDYTLPYWLKKRLPSNKDELILDFGCGFGQTLIELKKIGYKNVFGCDIDDHALNYCRSKGLNVEKVDSINSFVEKYKGKFDMVLMFHVLEHFPKSEIIPTLKAVKELLKEGGVLIITVPNAQSNTGAYWAYEDFTHEYLFTSGSIYYVLTMAGFRQIEFIDIDCTEGLPIIIKLIRKFLLKMYTSKVHFYNKITGSSFHKQSPEIYSFEIKVLAKKCIN